MIDKEVIKEMITDMRKTNPKKWKNHGFSVWVKTSIIFILM